ncbi:MAG: CPBP family intramembrane glutamic endopeptidase [Anaerolineaceae bacterium]
MSHIVGWIKRHQVLAFFIIAYAITWPGLFLALFIFPGNQIVEILASQVVFSPALAAMLISGIVEPRPKHARSRARWLTFVGTWIFASTVQILYFWKINHSDITAPIIVICCLFALFPAWIVSSAYSRNPGIRKQFSTLLKPRGPVIWYLVVFLIFPGIPFLAMGITRLFGGQAEFYLADLGFIGAAIYLLIDYVHGFLMTGGINEESGWRGFALPRLQSRYPVLVSAGIVWFFWALWHIPYDIGNHVPIAWMLENRLLWNLVFAILMTWLYNRTNGSILAAALLHPAMNTFGNQFSFNNTSRVLFIVLTIVVIVTDRMWKKLPEDSLAVTRTEDQTVELPQL